MVPIDSGAPRLIEPNSCQNKTEGHFYAGRISSLLLCTIPAYGQMCSFQCEVKQIDNLTFIIHCRLPQSAVFTWKRRNSRTALLSGPVVIVCSALIATFRPLPLTSAVELWRLIGSENQQWLGKGCSSEAPTLLIALT